MKAVKEKKGEFALNRRTLSTYEKKTVSMWKAINWSTLIVAFLTLVVIMTLNGGEIQL